MDGLFGRLIGRLIGDGRRIFTKDPALKQIMRSADLVGTELARGRASSGERVHVPGLALVGHQPCRISQQSWWRSLLPEPRDATRLRVRPGVCNTRERSVQHTAIPACA